MFILLNKNWGLINTLILDEDLVGKPIFTVLLSNKPTYFINKKNTNEHISQITHSKLIHTQVNTSPLLIRKIIPTTSLSNNNTKVPSQDGLTYIKYFKVAYFYLYEPT